MNPFQDHTKNLLQDNTIPSQDDDDDDDVDEEEHHHSQNLSAQDLDLSLGNIYNSDHSNSSAAAQGAVLDDLGVNTTRNQNSGESNRRNQNLMSENSKRNLQDFDGPALSLAVATNEIEAAGQSGFHQGVVDTNETLLLMEKKEIQKDYKSMKATNCPAKSLTIGKYEVNAKNEGDLVAKFYFGHRKIIWEISEGSSLKKKIVIPWSEISGIRADLASGFLQVEVSLFFHFFESSIYHHHHHHHHHHHRVPQNQGNVGVPRQLPIGHPIPNHNRSAMPAGGLNSTANDALAAGQIQRNLAYTQNPTGAGGMHFTGIPFSQVPNYRMMMNNAQYHLMMNNHAAPMLPPAAAPRPQNQGNVGVPRQLPIGHPIHNRSTMPAGTMMQMQMQNAAGQGQRQTNFVYTQNPTGGVAGIHFTTIPYSQVTNYRMMMEPGMMMNDPQYHHMMQNHAAAAAAGGVMWNSETMENRHLHNPKPREHLAIDAQAAAAAAGESSMSAGEVQQETGSGSNQNNPTSNAQ